MSTILHPLDLSSVTAKLGRARYHAETINNEVATWMNPDLYSISQHSNPNATRYWLAFHIKSGQGPRFEDWSLIAGDCMHNLRCALDHLVYAIAIHQSGANPPPCANRLQFPICDDDAGFAVEVKKNRLGTISDELVACINRLQFYNRGNTGPHEAILPPLSAIRDFDNLDKHKLLRVAFAALDELDIGFRGPLIPDDNPATFFPNRGELKDGAEIAAITFERSAPNMHFDRHGTKIRIVVEHSPRETVSGEIRRSDVTGLLAACINDVEHIVETLKQKC